MNKDKMYQAKIGGLIHNLKKILIDDLMINVLQIFKHQRSLPAEERLSAAVGKGPY
jgi:hypothetical protein